MCQPMSFTLPIYNTLSWQEKVVLVFTSMVFVAQPSFPIISSKLSVIILATIGFWILFFQKEIRKNAGFRQILLFFLLLGVPGLISMCGTYNIRETLWFVLLVPVFLLLESQCIHCFPINALQKSSSPSLQFVRSCG